MRQSMLTPRPPSTRAAAVSFQGGMASPSHAADVGREHERDRVLGLRAYLEGGLRVGVWGDEERVAGRPDIARHLVSLEELADDGDPVFTLLEHVFAPAHDHDLAHGEVP